MDINVSKEELMRTIQAMQDQINKLENKQKPKVNKNKNKSRRKEAKERLLASKGKKFRNKTQKQIDVGVGRVAVTTGSLFGSVKKGIKKAASFGKSAVVNTGLGAHAGAKAVKGGVNKVGYEVDKNSRKVGAGIHNTAITAKGKAKTIGNNVSATVKTASNNRVVRAAKGTFHATKEAVVKPTINGARNITSAGVKKVRNFNNIVNDKMESTMQTTMPKGASNNHRKRDYALHYAMATGGAVKNKVANSKVGKFLSGIKNSYNDRVSNEISKNKEVKRNASMKNSEIKRSINSRKL